MVYRPLRNTAQRCVVNNVTMNIHEKILNQFNIGISFDCAVFTPFINAEDGSDYEVWLVTVGNEKYVLKKAKNNEVQVYSAFFSVPVAGAPRFYGAVSVDGAEYLLIEYVAGSDLCKCDRASLTKALDALISLQDKFWDSCENGKGVSFSDSLKSRINRGNYLGDDYLEKAYSDFLAAYNSVPRTLCHDDLLPFNLLVSQDRATIIDWEVAGILPYPTSLARLIAHAKESEDAFFYMRNEDKEFAVHYYYDNLVKKKGISFSEYRRTLDLFLLYEYCEWIMLGNKYNDADMDRYDHYLKKAKEHIKCL